MSRILFITSKPYDPWEGACHRIRSTLEALVALDYEVVLLTPSLDRVPDVAGLRVSTVPRLPLCGNLPDGPSLRRFAVDTLLLFKAVFLAAASPFTLIHGVDDCGVVAWLTGRLTRTPCVFDRHTVLGRDNVRGLRRLGLGIHSFFERPALRWSDAVISNDPALVDRLSRFGRSSRACVIPDIPAVSEAVPEPARNLALARYKRFSEQRLVTCVGSYTRFKGLDLFFNAMPHVLASNPNVHFVVVGGSEQEIARVSQALEEAGLDSAVTFPGRIDPGELAALLAVSDVLVSPRRAGCCAPIKVLDYLLSGTPVVAADTPANRAVLTPDNAIITRPTPEALADGILKLCLFPHLADELGRRGRDTLREDNRTPEAFRTALQHCYEYVALQTKS